MKCPCFKSSESVEFKKSSLTYRPSNSLIESQHPTTPTRGFHNRQFNKGHKGYTFFSTEAPGLPYYTGALARYDGTDLPHSNKRHGHGHHSKGHPKHTSTLSGESTITVLGGSLPDETSQPTSRIDENDNTTDAPTSAVPEFAHVSEGEKYYKNIGEGTAGHGLTRAERRLLANFGDGNLVSKFQATGGKVVKKKPPPPPPPPKRHWKFPVVIWKARQKLLQNRKKGSLDSNHDNYEVVDKLIDEGQKWHKKKKKIISKKRSVDTKPKFVKTKIDAKPAWVSFDAKSLPVERLVGHSNYTSPESIPRMLKGYCIIEPCEFPECNNAGTQIRTYVHGYHRTTHNLQTVGRFSSGSSGCNDTKRDGYIYSQWPNSVVPSSSLQRGNYYENTDYRAEISDQHCDNFCNITNANDKSQCEDE